MFLGEAERLRQAAARLRDTWRPQPHVHKTETSLPYFRSRPVTR
jgi:hypothetical protein